MEQSFSGISLGRYHLRERIGAGGSGDVYLAQDTHMLIGREVPVKIITLPSNTENAKSAIALFEREIKAITQLNHPHILSIFDYGVAPIFGIQVAYMVMPLLQDSLDGWLKKSHGSDPLSIQDTAHVLQQAASALQEAHDHNIVHKDVKLQNFLVQKNIVHPHLPDLLLTDFGVAKLNTALFTIGNLPWGTPAYMPLEQWEGNPVSATDQYALAVMTYKLLTCRFPYQSAKPEEMQNPDWIREQHCNLDLKPEPLSKYTATIPPIINDVVLKALSKKPEDRYPSITDFAQAFQDALKRTEKGANIYMTLAINEAEAIMGAEYPLTLPNGQQTIIAVPAGAQEGQQLCKESEGETSPFGGSNGDLIITLVIKPSIGSDHIIKELQRLSQATDKLSPKTSSDKMIKQLQHLDDKIAALQSKLDSNPKAVYQQIQNISDTINAIAPTDTQTISMIKAYAIALATTTSQNLYPPYTGTLELNDPLSDNRLGNKWTISSATAFEGGTYSIIAADEGTSIAGYTSRTYFNNFTYQVLMIINEGNGGGILFRYTENCKQYLFLISKDGKYNFSCYRGCSGSTSTSLSSGYTSAFNQGLAQPNVVAVVAQGNDFDFYINFQHILHATDNTFTQGKIGVFAENIDTLTKVGFSNAKVWAL